MRRYPVVDVGDERALQDSGSCRSGRCCSDGCRGRSDSRGGSGLALVSGGGAGCVKGRGGESGSCGGRASALRVALGGEGAGAGGGRGADLGVKFDEKVKR